MTSPARSGTRFRVIAAIVAAIQVAIPFVAYYVMGVRTGDVFERPSSGGTG